MVNFDYKSKSSLACCSKSSNRFWIKWLCTFNECHIHSMPLEICPPPPAPIPSLSYIYAVCGGISILYTDCVYIFGMIQIVIEAHSQSLYRFDLLIHALLRNISMREHCFQPKSNHIASPFVHQFIELIFMPIYFSFSCRFPNHLKHLKQFYANRTYRWVSEWASVWVFVWCAMKSIEIKSGKSMVTASNSSTRLLHVCVCVYVEFNKATYARHMLQITIMVAILLI